MPFRCDNGIVPNVHRYKGDPLSGVTAVIEPTVANMPPQRPVDAGRVNGVDHTVFQVGDDCPSLRTGESRFDRVNRPAA